ncbi:MAG TPA: VWA domain-containing protein [Blastocatellia bacterium]|nr:VWA domain-containing protein [Blastocatellia bacterium]
MSSSRSEAQDKPSWVSTRCTFSVYEDNVKQVIQDFNAAGLPASVVLLLDLSRSMDNILPTIRDAASAAWNRFRPDDEVAIMTFAKNAEVVQPLSNDKRLLIDQINKILSAPGNRDRGQTSLDEAIYKAAAYLSNSSGPKRERSILAISDGQSNQERGHSR